MQKNLTSKKKKKLEISIRKCSQNFSMPNLIVNEWWCINWICSVESREKSAGEWNIGGIIESGIFDDEIVTEAK